MTEDTIADMRVDIGRMAAKMDSMTETLKEYIKRAEACQDDHETRLRAVEAAAVAVPQIADLTKRVGVLEKAQSKAVGGDAMAARIGAITGGIVGMICGVVGALVAVYSLLRGAG
jgi:hypothetical protein